MPVIIPSEATMDWLNVKYAAGDVLKAAWLDVQFQPEKGQQISMNTEHSPYTPAVLKRAIKTPKVYLRDTGLGYRMELFRPRRK